MALVFQYGSNTDTERLNGSDRLNGAALDLGRAVTKLSFRLTFNIWSTANNCAAANLKRDTEGHVWGVLFEIPDYLMSRNTSGSAKSLDSIEAEGKNYRREVIEVIKFDGTVVQALTYIGIAEQNELKTSISYISHILKGLREHDAPIDYINRVKQWARENNPSLTFDNGL